MEDVETLYNEAMAAWRRGAIDDLAVIERVEAGGEADPRTQHALGWVHRERGACGAADEAFTRALVAPRYFDDAAVWEACGDARAGCGRFQAAVDAYRRVRELAPGREGLAERLDDARARRPGHAATWLAGSFTALVSPRVEIDCVAIGDRHVAVVRTGVDFADGYVSIHRVDFDWSGGDELIHDQAGRWVAPAAGGARVAIGMRGATTIFPLDGEPARYLAPMDAAAWLGDHTLVGGTEDGRFSVWRHDDPRGPIETWRGPASVNGLEVLPGGRFAVCRGAASIELYDLERRKTAIAWPLADAGTRIAVSPDRGLVAVLGGATLSIWDRHRRRQLAEHVVTGSPRGLCFWPGNDHVLVSGDRIELWDVDGGRRRQLAALPGRLVLSSPHALVISDPEPGEFSRRIQRIRLGTLPPKSPMLAPPHEAPDDPDAIAPIERHPLVVDRPPPRDPLPTAPVPHLAVIPPDAKPFVFALLDVTTIGAAPECNLRLATMYCSRRHCRITRTPAGFVIVDLESTRGTIVNDRILRAERLLEPGDWIVVGDQRMRFGQGGANS